MLLKTGACFTKELELNCPTVVACVTALPTGLAAAAGDLVLGKDGKYHALPAAPAAPAPQTLSLVGNTVSLSGGGGSITVPDLDTQDLSLVGNVLSLTNGGSVTLPSAPGQVAQTLSIAGSTVSLSGGGGSIVLPAAAGVTFATPAETVAGTSTTLAVNPADLIARENIPAQTGLNADPALIPAPAANQSPWGVNTLGETLHYAPGLGWQIVANHANIAGSGVDITHGGGPSTAFATIPAPRAGKITVNYRAIVFGAGTWQGQVFVNGVYRTSGNSIYEPLSAPTVRAESINIGTIALGDVITIAGFGSPGTATFNVQGSSAMPSIDYTT